MIAANNSPGTSSRMEGPGERELPAIPARPTRRELAGIAPMGISCALGWPAMGLLGALSVRMSEPLLAAIGMPSLLVLSHLTFAVGLRNLAGGRRVAAFVSWMRRSRAR